MTPKPVDRDTGSPAEVPHSRDLRLLSRVPLLQSLPESERARLAARSPILELPPKTVLFREGDVGDRFYVVLEGQLEIFQAIGIQDERLLAVRGPGEFVGEMSLFNTDGRRTASVRSTGPVRLWGITRADFDQLIRRHPSLAYEMARVLSARMTAAQDMAIRDLEEKNRQLILAYEELKAAQAQIIEKERLERELDVAHQIQMEILPQKLPQLRGYDFGARIAPARAVGGDFYDLLPLGTDKMAIVVGDVSGKGVPAAISMAQIHTLLHARAHEMSTPAQILRHVNATLVSMGSASLFVTVLYGVLDRVTGALTYARAGHEPPMLATAGGEAHSVDWGSGQPLGFLDEPLLDQRTVTIPPGGTLLLYSDGITDARNLQGEAFGYERLEERLAGLAGIPAQELCDELWRILIAYQQGSPQYDDMTLVAVRAAESGND